MRMRSLFSGLAVAAMILATGCAGGEKAEVKSTEDGAIQTEKASLKGEDGHLEVHGENGAVETDADGHTRIMSGNDSVEVDAQGKVKIKGANGSVTVDGNGGLVQVESSGHE